MYDVALVLMPFANIHTPGLGISLLKEDLNRNRVSSKVFYENIQFAELAGFVNYLIPDYYGVFALAGEWVFSDSAGFRPSDEYFHVAETFIRSSSFFDLTNAEIQKRLLNLKTLVSDYIDSAASRILSHSPKIVACSSLFQQNNASFSLLKRVKEKNPDIITVLGGCNCSLDMGKTISEEIPYIDYVFSGEGDDVFAEFCKKVMAHGTDCPLDILPEGIIRQGMSREKYGVPFRLTKDMSKVPVPDFDDYFESIYNSVLKKHITVSLPIEGSRGCWWREKHQCTFCGLGNEHEEYRDKKTKQLVDEIDALSHKYQIHRYTFCDSILSNRQVIELPSYFQNNNQKKFFCEIKSNINKETIHALRAMGFSMLQPGIESLQDDYLKLMNKGNTAIAHISLLKHARSYGVHIQWNLLMGFPGEKEAYVLDMIHLFPKISHLQPPRTANHITYQKNSVYCNDSEKYGLKLRPMQAYRYVYEGNDRMIQGLAYNFEPVDEAERKIYYNIRYKGEVYNGIQDMTINWRECFYVKHDRMTMVRYREKIEILDYRQVAKKPYYTLTGAAMEVYLAGDEPVLIKKIRDCLQAKYSETVIDDAIKYLSEQYLSIIIDGYILSLANEITGYTYEKDRDNPAGWIEIDKEVLESE